MPIVLIVIGLAVAVGVGTFFLRPSEPSVPTTPITETSDAAQLPEADGQTVPPEPNDSALEQGSVTEEPGDSPVIETSTEPAATAPAAESAYIDGAHNVTTTYVAPGNANHTVAVTLTLANDVVTSAQISFGGDEVDTSKNFQSKFAAVYQTEVVGKKLDNIKLSRVGGASLTTGAFNEAVTRIKATAQN